MHEKWTNTLTDEAFSTQARGEAHGFELAQVFVSFPYALLRAHRP
jgi:(1->4)-alpha-D-glucan 1-alpha-D-glucosylmutase